MRRIERNAAAARNVHGGSPGPGMEAEMRIVGLLIGVAVLAAGAAQAAPSAKERGEAELAKELKGYVPGKKVRCVSMMDINGQTIIDGTAIIFRSLGGKLYVNRPNGAEFLNDDNVLVMKPTGSQHCSLDIVQQLDRVTHMHSGAISLNDFTLYTKAR
jgi:hypothetical protein